MKWQRIVLVAVGVAHIVLSVTAEYWWVAAFSATFAALIFLIVGILWERSTPTFADHIARCVYGAPDATQLLLTIPLVRQGEGGDGDPAG